jgi:hypothetical protein
MRAATIAAHVPRRLSIALLGRLCSTGAKTSTSPAPSLPDEFFDVDDSAGADDEIPPGLEGAEGPLPTADLWRRYLEDAGPTDKARATGMDTLAVGAASPPTEPPEGTQADMLSRAAKSLAMGWDDADVVADDDELDTEEIAAATGRPRKAPAASSNLKERAEARLEDLEKDVVGSSFEGGVVAKRAPKDRK